MTKLLGGMIRADSDPFRLAFLAARELQQPRRTCAMPEGFLGHCRDFFGTLVPTAPEAFDQQGGKGAGPRPAEGALPASGGQKPEEGQTFPGETGVRGHGHVEVPVGKRKGPSAPRTGDRRPAATCEPAAPSRGGAPTVTASVDPSG